MATARKLPSGKWRVRIYIKGHDPQYVSFTSDGTDRTDKSVVEKTALEYKTTWERTHSKPVNLTVGEAIDSYIANKSAILSPETVRGYKKLRNNTLQSLMNIKLSKLTQADIQAAVNEDAARLSPKTVSNAHGLLSPTLQEFLPNMHLRTKLPQKKKPAIVVPDKSVIDTLLEEGRGKVVGSIVVLGSVMGLRRSEMCALTWADVDLDKCLITINKAIVQNDNKEWVLKDPKSYAGSRTITIPAYAAEYLKDAPRTADRLIPITPCAASGRFRRLAAKHKVKMRLHDLRHYIASVMLSLGVPDMYAMERMGHATTNMLKSVYQHTMREKQEQIAKQIDDYFAGV